MTTPTLNLDVRSVGGSVAVIDIRGEVTAASEQPLSMAYDEPTHQCGAQALILNFTQLEYINGSGRGGVQRRGRSGRRAAAGFRKVVAAHLFGSAAADGDPRAAHPGVEGQLRQLLAEGQPVRCDVDRSWGGRTDRGECRRRHQV